MAAKKRPLHFALSGALLVPAIVTGCGPDEERPTVDVPAEDPAQAPEAPAEPTSVGMQEPRREPPPVVNFSPPDDPPRLPWDTEPQIELNTNAVGDRGTGIISEME